MLRELAQMGMRVARVMEQQVLGEATAAPQVADPVLALERMAEMVRLTLALEAKLDGLLRTRERKPRAIRIWRAALKGFPPQNDKPETAHRIVEKLIETEADPDEIAELVTEIARAVGAAAEVEPGLSDETVRMIKAKILGIRDAGPDHPRSRRIRRPDRSAKLPARPRSDAAPLTPHGRAAGPPDRTRPGRRSARS